MTPYSSFDGSFSPVYSADSPDPFDSIGTIDRSLPSPIRAPVMTQYGLRPAASDGDWVWVSNNLHPAGDAMPAIPSPDFPTLLRPQSPAFVDVDGWRTIQPELPHAGLIMPASCVWSNLNSKSSGVSLSSDQRRQINGYVDNALMLNDAAAGRFDAVLLALQDGADPNFSFSDGQTCLMHACRFGHLHAAKQLLLHGAHLEWADVQGQTACDFAVAGGEVALVGWLVSQGATLAEEDVDNPDLLMSGVLAGDIALVDVLVSQGADVTVSDPTTGCNLVHYAVATEAPASLLGLLICAQTINAPDFAGNTPLHLAAKEGQAATLGLLIQANAQINRQNLAGSTALHLACKRSDPDSVTCLLAAGARTDLTDHAGWTPLHFACESGQKECVRALLAARCNPNARDRNGLSPLHLARARGAADLVDLLQRCGATSGPG